MSALPNASKFVFPDQPYNFLRRQLPQLREEGLQLLNCMLTYDPDRRITARQALRHEFFMASARLGGQGACMVDPLIEQHRAHVQHP